MNHVAGIVNMKCCFLRELVQSGDLDRIELFVLRT